MLELPSGGVPSGAERPTARTWLQRGATHLTRGPIDERTAATRACNFCAHLTIFLSRQRQKYPPPSHKKQVFLGNHRSIAMQPADGACAAQPSTTGAAATLCVHSGGVVVWALSVAAAALAVFSIMLVAFIAVLLAYARCVSSVLPPASRQRHLTSCAPRLSTALLLAACLL